MHAHTAEEMMTVALQVAHDIRSPLAALTAVEQDLSALPDDTRELLRMAIQRIKCIASDLLDRTRGVPLAADVRSVQGGASMSAAGRRAIVPVEPLLALLIAEKRARFKLAGQLSIGFSQNFSAQAGGAELSVAVPPIDFQRAISALIDNAAEACEGKGGVSIRIERSTGKVRITIRDNGKGMSPQVLRQVGQRGFTHGKIGGSGLGLAYAKQIVEAHGGSFWIASELWQGTLITIELPQLGVGGAQS